MSIIKIKKKREYEISKLNPNLPEKEKIFVEVYFFGIKVYSKVYLLNC